VLGHS